MANEFYTFSVLVDHFHMSIADISELTDIQLSKIYFAKRNKKTGEIEPRKEREPFKLSKADAASTKHQKMDQKDEYTESYKALFDMHSCGALSTENFNENIEKLKAKFFPKTTEDKEEAIKTLKRHLANGIITQEHFEESLKRLA